MATLTHDDELLFDIAVAVGLSVIYFTISKLFYRAEKERAWILSAFCSTLCTIIGIYVCTVTLDWDIFHFSWDKSKILTETEVTRLTVRFFRVSNFADIGIGLFQYPSMLFVLTTWIHHGAYVLLCCWMLKSRCSILFAICLLEEIPTAFMAYGRMNKRLRSDSLFGLFYFLLRVSLHSWLAWSVMFQLRDDDRLSVVRFNFLLTEMLHLHWFISWIRQQFRLRRQGSNPAKELKDD